MKKNIIILFILIILVCSGFMFFKNKKPQMQFKTDVVKRGNLVETITASGTINPVTSISVGTQVSGSIKQIYVDFNSPVKRGQLLAQIDPSLFQAQVEQARANLYNARANYQKAQSVLFNDHKTYTRYKTLYEKNFIARSDVDLAETNYYTDKAQVESARAQIAQASAVLSNNEANLRYTRIISPVNGIVVSRNVDVGQTVAASFQTPTLFLVAQDLTKMQIDTNVAEADIGKVRVGQDVEYTIDGYPDMVFKGKVKQVRNAPTTVQNVVTYDVVINVDNEDYKLKPGMTANVSIITSKRNNVLLIPNVCLRFTPFSGNQDAPKFKHEGIWILKDEKPVRINVETGVSDGSFTEIVSGKISEGQQVITESLGSRPNKSADRPPMRMF